MSVVLVLVVLFVFLSTAGWIATYSSVSNSSSKTCDPLACAHKSSVLAFNMVKEQLENYFQMLPEFSFLQSSVGDHPGSTVYSRVNTACTQIYAAVGGSWRTGSGCYVALGADETVMFMTAAHCVMEVNPETGGVERATSIFVQNPALNTWVVLTDFIYDGVADIAFLSCANLVDTSTINPLTLAEEMPDRGSQCFVIGNPAGMDEDSMSFGIVRDTHFCEFQGVQKTDSVFVSCPAIGGNSGGPVLDKHGNVVGVYTFGLSDHEGFGGGSNVEVIKSVWTSQCHKRFLGIDWHVPAPYELAPFYSANVQIPAKGVIIEHVHPESPFAGSLMPGQLLLGFEHQSNTITFGNLDHQRTPGLMFYLPQHSTVVLKWKDIIEKDKSGAFSLSVNFSDLDASLDNPLSKLQMV